MTLPVDDYQNNAGTTGKLDMGTTASAVFEVARDRDWFKFHADAGLHYIFAAPAPAAGAAAPSTQASALRILDASGAPLVGAVERVDIEARYVSFDASVSGDYYLEAYGEYQGSYVITSTAVADDFSAANAGAGTLVPGASIAGLTQYDGDVDRFAVTLQANTYYTFSYAIAAPVRSQLHGMGLVAPDGTGIANAYWYDQPLVQFKTGAAGEYHLDFFQSYFNGASLPSPYAVSVSSARSDEIGDTPATARLLAIGDSAQAVLQGRDDVDVFRTTLQVGTTYAFALSAATANLSLNFLAADGSVTGTANNGGSGAYYTITPTRTGDFYAAVGGAPRALDGVAYTLSVAPAPDDVGASAASAGALVIGSARAGTLEAGGGDRDWFAVDLVAGATYWFTLKNADIFNSGTLRLLDASGAAITTAAAATGGSAASTFAFVASQSGTFYLEVGTSNRIGGGYTVGAAIGERDDYGSTPATAGALTPAAPLAGRFELGNDTDMLRISLTAGMVYGIDAVGAGDGAVSMRLADAAGTYISLGSAQGYHGNVFTATKTGDAYLTLSSTWSAPFNYTVNETAYGADDYAAGSATTATLAIGARAQGVLNFPGDVDSLRVHLDAGVRYVFQLLGAASGGGTVLPADGVALRLTGLDGNSYGSALAGAVDVRLGATVASGGDYTLSVYAGGYTAGMGSYTVAATRLSGDVSAPQLVSQSHAAGASGVGLGATRFSFTFNEAITADTNAITLKDSSGKLLSTNGTMAVSDNTLTFKAYATFAPGTYTVSLPHAGLHDLAGNAYAGPETISFTTVLPVALPTAGNDLLAGGGGVTIDGGAGIDMVVYSGDGVGAINRVGTMIQVQDYVTHTTDTLVNVERLLVFNTAYAYDLDGGAGQAYRLYQASFHRSPDPAGLGYWIGQLDQGAALADVARAFVGSAEFTTLYGAAPSDTAYLTALYANVLHRAPDAAGLAYWGAAMHDGGSRAEVLVQFSESTENKAALVGQVGDHFTYTIY